MPNVPRRINDFDAADITYLPQDIQDWLNSLDPGNVDDALDQLADRTSLAESLLNELLPASAPLLNSISTNNIGVSARLSFGPSASSNPAGYTNHPSLDVGDLFNNSSPNRGVISATQTLSGILSDNVVADPNGAFPNNSFGPGNQGSLNLIVNGSVVHSIDLSSFSSGSDLNSNGSGFVLSASTPVEFLNGSPFVNRQYRTGTWTVDPADLRNGYNTVQVEHDISSTTSVSQEYVYIVDDDTTNTVISDLQWTSLSVSGSKYLSGVEYHTSASAVFSADIANAYRKTYSDGNAVTYNVTNCSIGSTSLPDPSSNGYTNFLNNFPRTASLNTARIITNLTSIDGFRARVNVSRPLLSTQTSSYLEGFKLLIDRASSSSNDLFNGFDDENYRITSNSDFDTNLSGNWDSSISLVSASPGYSDGLQVINSGLRYPSLNFTNSEVTDGPSGNPDYSSATGERYFYGYFTDAVGAANFRLRLEGSGVQVINEDSSFSSSNQIKISIKLPNPTGNGTGWLDILKPFVEPNFADGDGCYAATFGSDTTINSSNWGLTVGTKNTANSFNKIYYRITAPDNFTGNLTRISITWAVV